VESLPLHHQLLYELIREAETLSPTELHARYETVAEERYTNRNRTPISQRGRRNKVRKLEEYDLIEIVGETRYREFRLVDETVTSTEEFEFHDQHVV